MKLNITFTSSQWERASEIFGNLGILSVGSVVIPYLFDRTNPISAASGLVMAIALWYISIALARKY